MGSRRIWAFWFISREDTGELAQLSLGSEEREKADRRSTLRPHCSLGREKVYRQKNRAEPVGHLIGHSWMVVCCANESVCLVFFPVAKIQTRVTAVIATIDICCLVQLQLSLVSLLVSKGCSRAKNGRRSSLLWHPCIGCVGRCGECFPIVVVIVVVVVIGIVVVA